MDYVPLDRRFEILSPDEIEGGPDWSMHPSGAGRSWDDLLKEPLAVILGPGGIGKTAELREQARRLRAAGQVAVFVPLDRLLDQSFREALDGEDATAFQDWERTGGTAAFLLDAVNEAKLTKASDFPRALRRFANAVGTGAGRVRVLLSCRPSDWLHRADAGTVRDALRGLFKDITTVSPASIGPGPSDSVSATDSAAPIPGAIPTVAVSVTVLRLAPLDEDRIRRLADHLRVEGLEVFIGALKRAGRLYLAGRPRDLEWLVTRWNEKRELGTLWDLLEQNVLAKLAERNPVYLAGDTLSSEKALLGAERLAGATILCRQPAIRLPDPSMTLGADRPGLDPAEVLADWSPTDIAALLRRPLFEEAPGGRVRFHHASIQSYLAGRWLLRLLEAGCPMSEVVDLLSREVYGERRLIPAMLDVAGWVISGHAAVRRELMPVAPELVLLWGDASRVPPEERAKALRRLAQTYQGAQWFWWTTEDDDLVRLSDPELTPTVAALLAETDGSVAVRKLLLDVVRVGGAPEAVDSAVAIALNAGQDLRVRIAAVEAVGGAGNGAQRARLRDYALEESNLPNEFLARVGGALLSEALSVEDAGALLAKFTRIAQGSVGGAAFVVGWRWVDACRPTDREALLARLIALTTSTPHAPDQRYAPEFRLSERYGWLIQAVMRTVVLEVERTASSGEAPAPLVRGLRLLYQTTRHGRRVLYDREALAAALAKNAGVRQALYIVALLSEARNPLVDFTGLEGRFCRSQPDDVDGLLARATSAETTEERKRLLLGAVVIARRHGLSDAVRDQLEIAIADAGLSTAEAEELRPWLEPSRPASAKDAELDGAEADAAATEAEQLGDARHQLMERIADIRTGEAFGALYYLVRQMGHLPGASAARWGQANIDSLAERFGDEIRDAAAEGLLLWWRSWCPPLPSARAGLTTVENGVLVGLTGLAVFASLGGDLSALSPEETRVAAHYALRELNGPPVWFETLLAAKPAVVQEVLRVEIAAALDGEVGHAA